MINVDTAAGLQSPCIYPQRKSCTRLDMTSQSRYASSKLNLVMMVQGATAVGGVIDGGILDEAIMRVKDFTIEDILTVI